MDGVDSEPSSVAWIQSRVDQILGTTCQTGIASLGGRRGQTNISRAVAVGSQGISSSARGGRTKGFGPPLPPPTNQSRGCSSLQRDSRSSMSIMDEMVGGGTGRERGREESPFSLVSDGE